MRYAPSAPESRLLALRLWKNRAQSLEVRRRSSHLTHWSDRHASDLFSRDLWHCLSGHPTRTYENTIEVSCLLLMVYLQLWCTRKAIISALVVFNITNSYLMNAGGDYHYELDSWSKSGEVPREPGFLHDPRVHRPARGTQRFFLTLDSGGGEVTLWWE